MKNYLNRLAKDLRKIYGNIGSGIEIAVDIDDLFFDIDPQLFEIINFIL
ncbi:MAG: hypothetical protein GY749_12980 [Desulfobacteraceae bacterium]|nr:hypothetical protein [Desulfobacteraceae bacterium]